MKTENQVKWKFTADYYQACNCDYGCPCEFQAPPTQGYCEAFIIWKIQEGQFGDISLNGISFSAVAKWPGAIHEGGGTVCLLIDENANDEQRKAIIKIATGEAGGIPFEIVAPTFEKVLDPQFVAFEFEDNGKHSRVRAGDAISAAFEPIRNAVTNEPESTRIEHGTGFLFKGADAVSTKENKVSAGDIQFSWPNKAAFLTQVNYAN